MAASIGRMCQPTDQVRPKFKHDQGIIFNIVIKPVRTRQSLWAFIDARGGYGKTVLINAILAAVRSMKPGGCVALSMATTGITAKLLQIFVIQLRFIVIAKSVFENAAQCKKSKIKRCS